MNLPLSTTCTAGLVSLTDTIANATNNLSLGTKRSGLVATMVTRFLCDLDLNKKSTSKFIQTSVCDFQTIKLWWIVACYELCHLHYTNWQLKICTWQLFFSSWWPKTWGFFLNVPTCRHYQVTLSLTVVQDIEVLGPSSVFCNGGGGGHYCEFLKARAL